MSAIPILQSQGREVLVVDDDAAMRTALEVSFHRNGWRVESASGKNDALVRFRQRRHGLVVTDIRMPDGSGFDLMTSARQLAPSTAVILLTAFGSVPDAVAAMKSGACEYLVKPVTFAQLLTTADRVVRAHRREGEGTEMVGASPALLQAIEQARLAARSDADILIEAESGTGKELMARMIHRLSSRREQPFVAINCAAVPETLLESELFGHGRGAFTGAVQAQAGKFELAQNGTLLLDEIGEMPLGLQPKLLRVLQEREIYRLGDAQPVKIDIRVIATTNRPLEKMVREGGFRADLYYRLNVIPLRLPPLSHRREDIRQLAMHFAQKFAKVPVELPEGFLKQLEDYAWPGNVRELANVVRRAVTLGMGSDLNLTSDTSMPAFVAPPGDTWTSEPHATELTPGMSLQRMERRLLEMTLDATNGNRSRTASLLGVSLRTVRNKIREYNLPPRSEYAAD